MIVPKIRPVSLTRLSPKNQGVARQLFPSHDTVAVPMIQQALRALVEQPNAVTEVALRGLLHEIASPVTDVSVEMASRQLEAGAIPFRDSVVIEANPEDLRLFKALDTMVVGQRAAKEALVRFVRSARSGFTATPKSIMLGGPPGVGKTELGKALAFDMYGDPDKHVYVDLSKIKNEADFNKIFGAPPGYAGFQENNTTSPFAPDSVRAKFGDGKAIVIWDEVDKIDPSVQGKFFDLLTNYLQTGKLELNNNQVVDMAGSFNVFTNNAGHNQAKHLKGVARQDAYVGASKQILPDHIISRIKNFVAADPLEASESRQIAEMDIRKGLRKATAMAKERGLDVTFDVNPEVIDFFGQIGLSKDFGARPLKGIIEDLLFPKIGEKLHTARDDEHYVLELDPSFTGVERARLEQAFEKAAPGIPAGVDVDTFPLRLRVSNSKPVFSSYESTVPHSDLGVLNVLGSFTAAGKSFVALNKGEFDSANELFQVQPGGIVRGERVPDSYRPIALPPELAEANYQLNIVELDNHRSLFMATSLPTDGSEPVLSTYEYDAKANTFKKVASPPLALAGAGIGGINGKVIMMGGRQVTKVGDAWSPSPHVELNNGETMQPFAFARSTDGEWRTMEEAETAGLTARAGYAVAKHNGQLYFAGGEVLTDGPTGTLPFLKSSKLVDIYNPETGTFAEGPELISEVTQATAVSHGDFLEVMGGLGLSLNRSVGSLEAIPKIGIQSLGTRSPNAKFKMRPDEAVPEGAVAGELRVIQTLGGSIVGPVFSGDSLTPQFRRYSVKEQG